MGGSDEFGEVQGLNCVPSQSYLVVLVYLSTCISYLHCMCVRGRSQSLEINFERLTVIGSGCNIDELNYVMGEGFSHSPLT